MYQLGSKVWVSVGRQLRCHGLGTTGWLHRTVVGPVFTFTSSLRPANFQENGSIIHQDIAVGLVLLILWECFSCTWAMIIKTRINRCNEGSLVHHLWCPAFCRSFYFHQKGWGKKPKKTSCKWKAEEQNTKQLAENTLFVGDFGYFFGTCTSLSFQYDHMQYSCGNWCCMGFSSSLFVAFSHTLPDYTSTGKKRVVKRYLA